MSGSGPHPDAAPPKPALPPHGEEEFRAWELEDRKTMAIPALLVSGLIVLALGVLDLGYFAGSSLGSVAVGARFLLAAGSLVAAWRVRRSQAPGVVDAWLFGWSLAMVGALAVRHLMAADQPPGHHTLDVALTFLWLALPNPLKLQIIPSLATVGTALSTPWGDAHPATLIGAYCFALAGGILVSWDRNRTARSRFRAVSEIRTLRGIIPICAQCKQVRDDNGFWRRVEEYVREHTEAEFTHGLCPACLEELYGMRSGEGDS